jgi:hypothetical protein
MAQGDIKVQQENSGATFDEAVLLDSGQSVSNLPTADQKAALAGTSGTPSASNKYVTNDDTKNTNSREWTADTVGQSEAEAGTATTRRAWTAERVKQAIVALGGSGGGLSVNTELTSATTLNATSYANKYIPCNHSTGFNVTVNASVFSAGNVIAIEQSGVGVITLVAGSGMTLNGGLKTWGQYSVVYIFFKSATVATVIGGSA